MTPTDATPQQSTVAVVGLGFMGRGIAACLLGHGLHVIGYDVASNAYDLARGYIERGLRELVEQAGFDSSLLTKWHDRYREARHFDDLATCEFVIESVAEETAAKRDVFDALESVVARDAPIASNTSAIPICSLQQGRRRPERFLGMHWFEPAHATRFLELIPGQYTSDITMNAAIALACRCGKEPSVLAKDIPGFIINRLGYALCREALNLLELGVADADTIDRSFRNVCGVWSTIFGPFQWMDLTGGPVLYAKCMKHVLPTLSNAAELPNRMARLAEEGAQGVVNGHGFYEYTPEQAERADALFHKHAWKARAMMNEYFPLKD